MSTVCASGAAVGGVTSEVVARAVTAALAKLPDRSVDLALLFIASRHSVQEALDTARELAPADWVASTTAGEFTEAGVTEGGVAVMLLSFGTAGHVVSAAAPLAGSLPQLAESLCVSYDELLKDAIVRGLSHSLSLVFGDGLSPDFERVVTELRRVTRIDHDIVGGGAADEDRFETTVVGAGGIAQESGIVALHVASETPWGIGIALGIEAASETMTVTRAEGNLVHAIDGRPAAAVYRAFGHANDETIGDEDWRDFLLENQLGIFLFDDIVRVRCGLEVRGSSVFFVGEVPEGSRVAVVKGEPDALLAASRVAAEAAKRRLTAPAAGVLVFSCVTRALVLGDRYPEELEIIRGVFGPDVPVAGFVTFGEVARVQDRHDGYHNHSIVVAAIPR